MWGLKAQGVRCQGNCHGNNDSLDCSFYISLCFSLFYCRSYSNYIISNQCENINFYYDNNHACVVVVLSSYISPSCFSSLK